MYNFRQKHPKKDTETNIKNKIKLNIYNIKDIPINNYKKTTNIDMSQFIFLNYINIFLSIIRSNYLIYFFFL